MIYRNHMFNDDNVLAYFQVKNGAIIDRMHKNKNLVTNITKFGEEKRDGGGDLNTAHLILVIIFGKLTNLCCQITSSSNL